MMFFALLSGIQYPFIMAFSRIAPRLTSAGYTVDPVVLYVFFDVDLLQHRFMYDLLMLDRQREEDRQPLICHCLILARAYDGHMVIPIRPILRNAFTKTLDPFCNDGEMQIRPAPYHIPYFSPPCIRFLDEKIRCHTNIYIFAGPQAVCSISSFSDSQSKVFCFFDFFTVLVI